ncbi:AI-2E family transporter [Telmatobacter bradus]|uniref:AI-2E family transporter n=1 Tax=Telmatobacter bradus TaxID=474953 RepID=UPI003B43980A
MPEQTRSLRGEIVFAFALALACYVGWLLRSVLVQLYVSALFAVVLTPVVGAIGRFSIRGWRPFKSGAIFLLLVLLLAAVLVFMALALPPVIRDLQDFAAAAPVRVPALLDRLKGLPYANHIDGAALSVKVQDLGGKAAGLLVASLTGWAGDLFDLAMSVILIVYFLLEGNTAYRWFLSLCPAQGRARLDRTLRVAEVRMGKWLVGQFSLMVILGVVSTLVYASLGLRYAYALGVLTGTLNIIPVLGAAICIVLAMLVAAIDSWGRVLGIAIFYLLYLQLENSVLIPRIMKNTVGLPGLAILVALLIGSSLAGVVGAMVSVPTAVLVSVLVEEYLIHREPAPAA